MTKKTNEVRYGVRRTVVRRTGYKRVQIKNSDMPHGRCRCALDAVLQINNKIRRNIQCSTIQQYYYCYEKRLRVYEGTIMLS